MNKLDCFWKIWITAAFFFECFSLFDGLPAHWSIKRVIYTLPLNVWTMGGSAFGFSVFLFNGDAPLWFDLGIVNNYAEDCILRYSHIALALRFYAIGTLKWKDVCFYVGEKICYFEMSFHMIVNFCITANNEKVTLVNDKITCKNRSRCHLAMFSASPFKTWDICSWKCFVLFMFLLLSTICMEKF